MQLVASSEQRLIGESGARLFAGRPRPRVGTATDFDAGLWSQLAAGGWLGFLADDGTPGADVAMLMIEAGKAGVAVPLVDCALAPGRALGLAGRTAELEGLAAGRLRLALAAEPVAGEAAPRVLRTGAGWIANGACIAPAGGWCERFLVRVERDGHGGDLLLVEEGQPGLAVERRAGMDGGHHAMLRLDGAPLGLPSLLGLAAPATDAVLAAACAAACAEAVGDMTALLSATRDHALSRKQFGRPIASFQVIEHRIARMVIAVEEARALALLAAIRLRAGERERNRAVAAAKARIGALSRFVAQNAVQTHGGMGVSEDMPVGHHFRRLMTFEARHGATRRRRDEVAAYVRSAASLGASLLDVGAEAA